MGLAQRDLPGLLRCTGAAVSPDERRAAEVEHALAGMHLMKGDSSTYCGGAGRLGVTGTFILGLVTCADCRDLYKGVHMRVR